jgi:putative transposase
MPWRETTKVNERAEMVRMYQAGWSVTDLALHFGVSRPTVYLWIERQSQKQGLMNRPTRPGSCPHQTDEEMVERLVEAKHEKPQWGPRKQRRRLLAAEPDLELPSIATIGRIYSKHGLVKPRRRRRKGIPIRRMDQIIPKEPGEMMSSDHKGWFRLGNGQYCYPLTINEPVSRYIYAIESLSSTSLVEARPVFEKVFREHGVPKYMLSDNGGPFCCSQSLGGLTRLSAWWIKLGILPLRIRKGHPWENGIHERMHRTLKAETTRPPAPDAAEQQKRFDVFRKEFNEERPHEALNDEPPISLYKRAPREYVESASKAPMDYPGHFEVRAVRRNGVIKFKGRLLFLTETLVGERVGLEEVGDGTWALHFGPVQLAEYDERTASLG